MACLGENTVTDLVESLLAPARRAIVEAHTAHCETCRRLISELVRRSGDEAPGAVHAPSHVAAGTRVGRYVVRDQIGSGAMGAIYAAHDPQLDRVIALKLVHPGDPAQRERVQREARALARLAHPNVVTAFDVGELDGDLVLAMELVEGTNLRTWMESEHAVGEVLDVFRQAGRGLAAAHAAELAHRDFKPENVIVGADGRVRVVDFGLAAGRDGGTELVGTPAYMAPEQFESGRANAASDQFAFCVALHEALYGRRPFVVNLAEEVSAGPIAAPSARKVPAYVKAVLERGLQLDPARRFPAMPALLAALEPRRTATRTRVAIAGGAGLAIALVAIMATRSTAAPCQDSAVTFASVWNAQRAMIVHARFIATGAPFAESAWRAFAAGMDDFGQRWIAGQTQACEATRVRGVQSDHTLTLRSACLERALAEADELATTFAAVDRHSIEHAATAVDGLPSLAECANVTALLAPIPPPADRDVEAVAAVTRQLARVRALSDAAKWTDARALATSSVTAARQIAHEPTRAAALFVLGRAEEGAGAAKQAEASLRDAFAAAELGHDDLQAARAATELVFVIGQQQNRLADGLEWAFHADTALKRAGGDPELEARLADDLGHIRYSQGSYALAHELYQKSVDLWIKATGPTSRPTAETLFNLGRAVTAEGDNAGGLAVTKHAIAILETKLGPDHPDLAIAQNGLGSITLNQGDFTEALASFDHALAIAEPALGEQHPEVGRILIGRGEALRALGRHAEALDTLGRALRIFDRGDGDQVLLAEALTGRGDALRALGRTADALASYQRGLAIREATYGHDHEVVASSLESISDLEYELGHDDVALVGYRAALAIRDKVDPPDYYEKAYALTGIGEAEWHRGHATEGVAPLRRAVELLTAYDGDPVTLAGARFSLARAIWDAHGDRDEARELADTAEAVFAKASPEHGDAVIQVQTWMRAHGAPR